MSEILSAKLNGSKKVTPADLFIFAGVMLVAVWIGARGLNKSFQRHYAEEMAKEDRLHQNRPAPKPQPCPDF